MARLWIIRPGATDYEEQGRLRGRLDIPLSEGGRAEVLAMLERMKQESSVPKALYYSPCRPAVETAELLGEALSLKPRALPALQNFNYGLWQGMLIDEVKTKQPKVYRQWQDQPEITCPPEGEMLDDARGRLREALARIAKKHHRNDDDVALIVPEPLATLVHQMLAGDELGDLWKSETRHGSYEILDVPLAAFRPSSSFFAVWSFM
ncbi:histidine phosphatase family protein [Thermostilla marina]